VRAIDRAIVITLAAPASSGGAKVTSYDYSLDGGLTWHNGSGRTKPKKGIMTVIKLVNGTTYHLELRARNAVGPGPATSPVSVTPRTVPGAPTHRPGRRGDTLRHLDLHRPSPRRWQRCHDLPVLQ
jgi:titin